MNISTLGNQSTQYGKYLLKICTVTGSVSDPDPYWIRIQSDHWIRIRNLNTDPDPDPGGQK